MAEEIDIITLTNENIDSEHICCAIGNDKSQKELLPKAWLKERFPEGHTFKNSISGESIHRIRPC